MRNSRVGKEQRGEAPHPFLREVAKAEALADLYQVNLRLTPLIIELTRSGVDILRLMDLSSDIHDRIILKAIDLLLRTGEYPDLPADFSFLVLGSEGRKEQAFSTDQDNALVLGDSLDRARKHSVARFSQALISSLVHIGIPLCPGGTMASNKSWRKSLEEWIRDLDEWVTSPRSESIIRYSTLLDMRTIYGKNDLEVRLKEHIRETSPRNSIFLFHMTQNVLRFSAASRLFGHFRLEKSGPHKGELDIKKGGIFPLLECVKILSLEHGILESSTIRRLVELQECGAMSPEYKHRVQQAFESLLRIRLENQIQELERGEAPSGYVNPDRLPREEREELRSSLLLTKELGHLLRRRQYLA